MYLLKKTILLLIISLSVTTLYSQEKLEIKGVILDDTDFGVPYAAISIPSKQMIGTTSNGDGKFSLVITKENMLDTLSVSSIGYVTNKVAVKDFLAKKEKTIILKADVVSLDVVQILNPAQYADLAYENLKENTVSSVHELTALNRYFTVENGKAKYLIEHYIKMKDRGPTRGDIDRIEVVEGRKSVDYRYFPDVKVKRMYPITQMTGLDPLRNIRPNDYTWTKIDNSSYDGEDIIIVRGQRKNKRPRPYKDPILYIGMDSYKVYKTTNESDNLLYIYKKNQEGKMYLSYHRNFSKTLKRLSSNKQSILKTKNKNFKISVRIEVVVLGIETDKKKVKTENSRVYSKNMEDVDVKYNPNFWNNFNFPPATEYYKERVKELESIYGVPLETQFNLVNK